jgi:hypothetical protein
MLSTDTHSIRRPCRVFDPGQVIQAINMALRPGGLFYALNQSWRCVPTDRGWTDDGFDLRCTRSRFLLAKTTNSTAGAESNQMRHL